MALQSMFWFTKEPKVSILGTENRHIETSVLRYFGVFHPIRHFGFPWKRLSSAHVPYPSIFYFALLSNLELLRIVILNQMLDKITHSFSTLRNDIQV